MPAQAPPESTLHEPTAQGSSGAAATVPMVPALALVWSQEEAARVGEVVCLPRTVGVPFTIGRADVPGDDGVLPLGLTRLRPYARVETGPLRAGQVSRWQLRVRVVDEEVVLVEPLGRVGLRLNGEPVEGQAHAQVGDLLEVQGRFSLLVTRRPSDWGPGDPWSAPFPFGEADAHGIVGESPATWELRRRIAFVAPLREHVLVHGPTGAGKELVVQALHRQSVRAASPLIVRAAATLPEARIDAELFGTAERAGLVAEAEGGALFLDELGALPLALQARLLRVLDTGEYHREGEPRARVADLRVLAATPGAPTELRTELQARFIHRIRVSGLDERREDLPLIVRHLLRRMAREPAAPERVAGASLIAALIWHPFTAHTRELLELLWRAVAASPGPVLVAPPDAAPPPPPRPSASYTAPDALGRDQVLAALAACGGVREQAWRMLGLRSRDQLKRLLKKLAIDA